LDAKCARLGLYTGLPQRRLQPMPKMNSRLPPTIVRLAEDDALWENFCKKCGTDVFPESPLIPGQLVSSGGGGRVLLPMSLGTKAM